MLKIIKTILGGRPSKTPTARQPSKPSQELLNHYRADLAIVEMGAQQNPTDPHEMAPVPRRALFRNGEYFGHPLNSFGVPPNEIIPLLEVHRDQSLWLSVIAGLNYDFPITIEVIEWILSQPDCDGLNALKAFDYLCGPHFCGKHVEDRFAKNSSALPPLKVIVDREQAGNHFVIELACDFRSRNGETSKELVEKAYRNRNDLKADERPILAIPETTLLAGGKGTKPVEEFCVDEDGILVLPIGQAALIA